jgi:hypothetical protein
MTIDRTAEHSSQIEPDLICTEHSVGALDPACPDQVLGDLARGDRRRPGRSERVSPVLIELLRYRPDADVFPIEDGEAPNTLRTAWGICIAAVIGAACWVSMIGLVLRLIR